MFQPPSLLSLLIQAISSSLEAQLAAAQATRDSCKKDAADVAKQLKQLGPKLGAAEKAATEAAEALASIKVSVPCTCIEPIRFTSSHKHGSPHVQPSAPLSVYTLQPLHPCSCACPTCCRAWATPLEAASFESVALFLVLTIRSLFMLQEVCSHARQTLANLQLEQEHLERAVLALPPALPQPLEAPDTTMEDPSEMPQQQQQNTSITVAAEVQLQSPQPSKDINDYSRALEKALTSGMSTGAAGAVPESSHTKSAHKRRKCPATAVVLGLADHQSPVVPSGSDLQQVLLQVVPSADQEMPTCTPVVPRRQTRRVASAGGERKGDEASSSKDEGGNISDSSSEQQQQCWRPHVRKQVCIDSSSSSSSESSSSGEEEGGFTPYQRRNCVKLNKRPSKGSPKGALGRRRANPPSSVKGKHQQQRQQHGDAAKGDRFRKHGDGYEGGESDVVFATIAAKLHAELDQLQQREAELAEALAKVRPEVLEQDLAALKQLWSEQKQLAAAEKQYEAVAALHGQLVDERYNKLASALRCINEPLAGIYRQLTGGVGDAYCSYTLEKTLLFREGVTLHVRPDHQRWRTFAMLSGGQQALAALALSFALQVSVVSRQSMMY